MEVAREYITCARQLFSNGCFAKAFDLYLLAFQKDPDLKELFEVEFRTTVLKLNETLAGSKKVEDIFLNFGKAINTFPDNINLLNEVGKYLYKFGFYEESWSQFQRALKVDPGFVNAEKNLNSVKNVMVERWHFRMLNDKIRNSSYRTAIRESTIPIKESILDLGTGTGLLAMYATERNPMTITACDSSEVMTELTDCILAENKLLMAVIVVAKVSTAMDYKDIGGKRSLLFTEVFDAGLFGENILQSLAHAWKFLLSKNAKVIPYKAEFFLMGAKSELLNAKYQLQPHTKTLLNIPNVTAHIQTQDESYDAEDVHYYKDIEYLTEPESVVTVEFGNLQDIQDKLDRTEPFNVELKANASGIINAYIGWFNLYLTDSITITTNPLSENRANAWQQAVFYDEIPRNVEKDETINLQILMNSGKLTLVTDVNRNIMRISQEMLKFLNDAEYLKLISGCIGMASVYLGQMSEMADLNILDLCPFPMFGLLMLRRGVQSLHCYAKNEKDKLFIEEVLKANDIDPSKVTFLIGDDWTQDTLQNEKFHAIFCNILDTCGEMNLRLKDIARSLKADNLIQGGLFMPAAVKLIAQIASSEWLDLNNVVYDENLGGYKVAIHVNKYQVSQNYCLDFTHLEYTALAEPVTLGNCYNLEADVVNVPILHDGEVNCIICWYKIELIEDFGEILTKRSFSFIDGTAFMVNPKIKVTKGDIANILCCVDPDGTFKLMIDVENT